MTKEEILKMVTEDLNKAFLPWKIFFGILFLVNLGLLILACFVL